MSARSTETRRPTVAARHLCTVATLRGVTDTDVLAGTSLSPADLADPDGEVSDGDEITMVRNLLRLVPDSGGIGVAVGSRVNLTNLGMFGFAAMASGTLRELMSIGLRFFSLTTLRVSVELIEVDLGGGTPVTEVVLGTAHLPEDVRRFFVERDIAAVVSTVPAFVHPVLSRYVDQIRIELAVDEEYLRPLLASVGLRDVEYRCERTVIRVPRKLIDEPLPQADENTLAICVAQCEQILERRNRRHGFAAVVRSQLLSAPGGMPGLDEVAACLHLHPRTLRRRLAEEGTSFRSLSKEVRAALAAELLSQFGLTVEQIARRLGYAETAAFNHAFFRWYGCAPSEYRSKPVTST